MEIETIHIILHVIQIVTTLGILYIFIRNYNDIKSRFNLGLVVFIIAVLGQVLSSISLNTLVHTASDVAMLLALLIFLNTVRK